MPTAKEMRRGTRSMAKDATRQYVEMSKERRDALQATILRLQQSPDAGERDLARAASVGHCTIIARFRRQMETEDAGQE